MGNYNDRMNKFNRELNKTSEMGWMSKESAVAAVKNLIEN